MAIKLTLTVIFFNTVKDNNKKKKNEESKELGQTHQRHVYKRCYLKLNAVNNNIVI